MGMPENGMASSFQILILAANNAGSNVARIAVRFRKSAYKP